MHGKTSALRCCLPYGQLADLGAYRVAGDDGSRLDRVTDQLEPELPQTGQRDCDETSQALP